MLKRKILEILILLMMAILLFAFNVRTGRSNPDTGLAGYWKFDEGSGNIAHDSSGNENTGALVNEPQWASGKRGSALSFDGVDDYVTVPSSSSLTISGQEITVELWFKSPTKLDSNSSPLVNIIDKGNEYVFQMGQDGYGHHTPDGKIWFAVILQPNMFNWQGIQTATQQWIANTWYHLAGTFDGSYLRVYVNGLLENSRALSGSLFAQGAHPLGIGCATFMAPDQYCDFFNGIIDEVKIYSYSRTAEEISTDYSSLLQSPVGGEWVPLAKLELLAPWLGSGLLMLAISASFVCFKRIKKRQN